MNDQTNKLDRSVVVFSKNYLPISRVNLRKAVVLLVTDKAEPLDLVVSDAIEVRSPSTIVFVPDYIRLKISSNERIWKIPPVTRKEILKRDRHQCQYCGSKKNLTIDHVIPRSLGGKHCWENVVIACVSCNSRKGDRTPERARMPLTTKPKAPAYPTIVFAKKFWHEKQSDFVNSQVEI